MTNKSDFDTTLFDDFVSDKKIELKLTDAAKIGYGTGSIEIHRSVASLQLCLTFGVEDARTRAHKIKRRLRGKEGLFWLYAAAQSEFFYKKTRIDFYDYWTKIRVACREFLEAKISKYEFKELISTIPIEDKSQKPPFEYLMKQKESLLAFLGKDWRRAHSPLLRNVIIDSVDNICSVDNSAEPTLDKIDGYADWDGYAEKLIQRERGHKDPVRKEVFKEVFEHLQLFGVDLHNQQTVENIYYHHK
jgi:hypothetical protein